MNNNEPPAWIIPGSLRSFSDARPNSTEMDKLRKAMSERRNVVIIGGGFGGLSAAQHLNSNLADVTLIDRRNYHLFQPLLYQVATGSLSPGEIAFPLRSV